MYRKYRFQINYKIEIKKLPELWESEEIYMYRVIQML